MLTQGSSELWNCILFELTILDHSTLHKLYVCLWKFAVWKILSFYFYMYLKTFYILLFFNPAMMLLWQPVMESKWAKHVCQTSWSFSLQFFTIKITGEKTWQRSLRNSVPNSFFLSHFSNISPAFQLRRKNEQWLNVD